MFNCKASVCCCCCCCCWQWWSSMAALSRTDDVRWIASPQRRRSCWTGGRTDREKTDYKCRSVGSLEVVSNRQTNGTRRRIYGNAGELGSLTARGQSQSPGRRMTARLRSTAARRRVAIAAPGSWRGNHRARRVVGAIRLERRRLQNSRITVMIDGVTLGKLVGYE